jgi:hypothetical protein
MHVINRLLATVFSLALFLGGLLTAVNVVLVQLGRPSFLVPTGQWSAWFRAQTFDAGIVRGVCAGLVLLGLLLLVAALRRGRPHALPLPSRTEGVRITASRKEVQHSLAATAGRVDGVQDAHVKAKRRKVRVKASTPLRDAGDLQQRVTTAISGRLGDLGLDGTLRPRVTVSSKGSR